MKIFYTGIGASKTNYLLPNDFIALMRRIFHSGGTYWKDQLEFKDFNLPNDFDIFTLNDWIEYSGAEITQ
jgi:hypothetical protein